MKSDISRHGWCTSREALTNWPWQFVATMDAKAVCKSLEGKRYWFLAKKEVDTMKTNASNTYNLLSYKAIGLIR